MFAGHTQVSGPAHRSQFLSIYHPAAQYVELAQSTILAILSKVDVRTILAILSKVDASPIVLSSRRSEWSFLLKENPRMIPVKKISTNAIPVKQICTIDVQDRWYFWEGAYHDPLEWGQTPYEQTGEI